MRLLIIMQGLPASGKSTLIRDAHLEDYAIEPDRLRLLAAAPRMGEDGGLRITQDSDAYVWRLVYDLAEHRMSRGDTTVVDATNTRTASFTKWAELARRYRYRVAVVAVDTPVEECIRRNAVRTSEKRVPEDVIYRMAEQMASARIPKDFERWDADALTIVSNLATEFGRIGPDYRRVKVIGDIHSSATALAKAVPEGVGQDPECLYVLAGDLFDRGIEAADVARIISPVVSNRNVVFVEGNHERHIVRHVTGTERVNKDGTKHVSRQFAKTLDALYEAFGHDETERFLKALTHRLVPCFAFSFSGHRFLVTHAGLSEVPGAMGLVSEEDCIFGVGGYETPIDQIFDADGARRHVIQVHGHRRTYPSPHSICLESGVEFGGYLSVLVIEGADFHVERTKNDVFDKTLKPYTHTQKPKETDVKPTQNMETNAIMASPWIRVKPEPDHDLVSLAFTRKAFSRGHWDKQTTRARGLFVDAVTGDVRLRAYDKFFEIGERPETTWEALSRRMAFPAQAWRKENGFLGIMGVVDGDVVLATKGSTTGEYKERFERIWNLLEPETTRQLTALASSADCSLLFEVLATDDEHIIYHDTDSLVFLDAVRNSYVVGGVNIDPAFSARVRAFVPQDDPHLAVKHLEADLDGISDIRDWLESHAHDRDKEGIVICDSAGFMVKAKLPYYRVVKRLRSSLEAAQAARSHGRPLPEAFAKPYDTSEMASTVELFMQDVLATPDWTRLDVIGAARLFEDKRGIDLAYVPMRERGED